MPMDIDHARSLELAQEQLQRGQALAAIETLARVLGEDPEDADAHALLALCLVRRKRLHAARLEAARALQIEPEHYFPHLAVATVASASRQFAEAEKHLLIAQTLSPEAGGVERELARLYLY